MKCIIEELKQTQRDIIAETEIDADTKVRSIMLLERQIQKLIRTEILASRTRWNIIDQLEELKLIK
jgi:hypothetical protein